ncbi:SprT-like domain-containing protein [bacterium SCSIO 12643]|nr:SprT-like domain-containing protein [bacterium SCSIO 12643]
MDRDSFLYNLSKHIPEGAQLMIWDLIKDYNFVLTITRDRVTKNGDYRIPMRLNEPHKISVNGTLNPYAFLLTLLHEIAHMIAFEKYGKRIKPHGIQWKKTFSGIAKPFLIKKVWPEDVTQILLDYFRNPKASSAGHQPLARVLRKYDPQDDTYLEDIPEGSIFSIKSQRGRWFLKGNQRRTRFLCREIDSGREYTIHGMAKVLVKQ